MSLTRICVRGSMLGSKRQTGARVNQAHEELSTLGGTRGLESRNRSSESCAVSQATASSWEEKALASRALWEPGLWYLLCAQPGAIRLLS